MPTLQKWTKKKLKNTKSGIQLCEIFAKKLWVQESLLARHGRKNMNSVILYVQIIDNHITKIKRDYFG